jgi:hypothetical protein
MNPQTVHKLTTAAVFALAVVTAINSAAVMYVAHHSRETRRYLNIKDEDWRAYRDQVRGQLRDITSEVFGDNSETPIAAELR